MGSQGAAWEGETLGISGILGQDQDTGAWRLAGEGIELLECLTYVDSIVYNSGMLYLKVLAWPMLFWICSTHIWHC